jgi:hypothetical protein
MAPTCPQGCFLFFEGLNQLGGTHMPPRHAYYVFEGVGASFPIKFPNSSHQYPIKILLFSSSSQTILIKFLVFSSITHKKKFLPIKFPKSFHSHFRKVASGPTSKMHLVLIHLKLSCVGRSVWPIDKSLTEDGCHFKCQGEKIGPCSRFIGEKVCLYLELG